LPFTRPVKARTAIAERKEEKEKTKREVGIEVVVSEKREFFG